ncbi:hypothetical protein B0H16DRAFT_1465350 [Mycena metata]|uniref:Uncharacterized protein n=1 Tax=Mycena metata TaxID=1033252 RepID=A0AAD7IBH0_9AGAR|nr:hypothetical protein B0H16DRAFT_1465350 [Mycena metata]
MSRKIINVQTERHSPSDPLRPSTGTKLPTGANNHNWQEFVIQSGMKYSTLVAEVPNSPTRPPVNGRRRSTGRTRPVPVRQRAGPPAATDGSVPVATGPVPVSDGDGPEPYAALPCPTAATARRGSSHRRDDNIEVTPHGIRCRGRKRATERVVDAGCEMKRGDGEDEEGGQGDAGP